MKVMAQSGREDGRWLSEMEKQTPHPLQDEVLIKVEACGVCRTDLHILQEDLPVLRQELVPGHEVVGTVHSVGKNVAGVSEGDRVGLMWLHGTCGKCPYCTSGRENLCAAKEFTGYSVDGGYGEYAIGREAFLLPLPRYMDAEYLAPLLCSGIIGYRALKLALPPPSGRLGIFGFGGSAHITLQVAARLGADVCVVSRSLRHLQLAETLGAAKTVQSGSDVASEIGEKFDSAIVFAPAGSVVRQALECVKPGGRVAVPAVHLDSIPEMDYSSHLFREKKLFSVEANTRADAQEFIGMAFRLGIRTEVKTFELGQANLALEELLKGRINGAAVLKVT